MSDITLNEGLEEKANELGAFIKETNEYKEVKEKQSALFDNEDAMQLLTEFNKLQAQNHKKQQAGQVTQEDMKAVEQAELRMLENPLIKDFHESQVKFQRVLNEVMKMVVEASK
ncbi:MAG: YlbF family regulator [Firmicutes bacterium]|nr:YlbF family regulator [Bacillota bacterium]